MKGTRITSIAILLGLALISACNLQVAGPPSGNAVASAIAQTMSEQTSIAYALAGTLTAIVPAVPTSTPIPSDTTTPSALMVSVSLATNCRTGPGNAYDMIGALPVGKSAEVVGKDAYGQYWIIKNPNNPGTCWLWGKYATVTGDTSQLPVIAAPPTPTLPPPMPTPTKTHPPSMVTAVSITMPHSIYHVGNNNPDCSFNSHFTYSITADGPVTVTYHFITYMNGSIQYTGYSIYSMVFNSAGTQYNTKEVPHNWGCGNWVFTIETISPNKKTAQTSFKVVSP